MQQENPAMFNAINQNPAAFFNAIMTGNPNVGMPLGGMGGMPGMGGMAGGPGGAGGAGGQGGAPGGRGPQTI